MLAKARGWCRCESGRGFRVEETGELLTGPYRVNAHAVYLKWFGLVEHRKRREAMFRAARFGVLFLRGEAKVPARILCRAGRAHYISEEMVSIRDVSGVKLDKEYWDGYPWNEVLGMAAEMEAT